MSSNPSLSPYAARSVVSGVRGRHEDYLRQVIGTIDTTGPTIVRGIGFSITTKTGTGDVTIGFSPAFAEAPTITYSVECAVGGDFRGCELVSGSVTAASFRIRRKFIVPSTGSVTLEDGVLTFAAEGKI